MSLPIVNRGLIGWQVSAIDELAPFRNGLCVFQRVSRKVSTLAFASLLAPRLLPVRVSPMANMSHGGAETGPDTVRTLPVRPGILPDSARYNGKEREQAVSAPFIIRAMTCICSPIIRIELVGKPALYERFASYVIFGAFSAISQGHHRWFPGGQGRKAERTDKRRSASL